MLTEDRRSFDRHQYPSMDYTGLYKALGKIVNVVPIVEIGVEGTFYFDVCSKCRHGSRMIDGDIFLKQWVLNMQASRVVWMHALVENVLDFNHLS